MATADRSTSHGDRPHGRTCLINLGFPRMGALPRAQEVPRVLLGGATRRRASRRAAAELRERNWRFQAGHGIDHIPSGDFSLYDHVLDTAMLVGAVPERYDVGRPPAWTSTSPWPEAGLSVNETSRPRDDQVVRHELPLPGP